MFLQSTFFPSFYSKDPVVSGHLSIFENKHKQWLWVLYQVPCLGLVMGLTYGATDSCHFTVGHPHVRIYRNFFFDWSTFPEKESSHMLLGRLSGGKRLWFNLTEYRFSVHSLTSVLGLYSPLCLALCLSCNSGSISCEQAFSLLPEGGVCGAISHPNGIEGHISHVYTHSIQSSCLSQIRDAWYF